MMESKSEKEEKEEMVAERWSKDVSTEVIGHIKKLSVKLWNQERSDNKE